MPKQLHPRIQKNKSETKSGATEACSFPTDTRGGVGAKPLPEPWTLVNPVALPFASISHKAQSKRLEKTLT